MWESKEERQARHAREGKSLLELLCEPAEREYQRKVAAIERRHDAEIRRLKANSELIQMLVGLGMFFLYGLTIWLLGLLL